jgi:hypothetical protein
MNIRNLLNKNEICHHKIAYPLGIRTGQMKSQKCPISMQFPAHEKKEIKKVRWVTWYMKNWAVSAVIQRSSL